MVKSKRRINKLNLIHGSLGKLPLEFYSCNLGLTVKDLNTGQYIGFDQHFESLEDALAFWDNDDFNRFVKCPREEVDNWKLEKLV